MTGADVKSLLPLGFSSDVVTFADSWSAVLSTMEVCSGCSAASAGAFTGVSSAIIAGRNEQLRRVQRLREDGVAWERVGRRRDG